MYTIIHINLTPNISKIQNIYVSVTNIILMFCSQSFSDIGLFSIQTLRTVLIQILNILNIYYKIVETTINRAVSPWSGVYIVDLLASPSEAIISVGNNRHGVAIYLGYEV